MLNSEYSRELETLRHSCAHLLAQAVQRLFPNALKATGPATHNGFYYDFDADISNDDLIKIEREMKKIVKERLDITREVVSKSEAVELFTKLGERYKVEILDRIEGEVTIFRQGEFVDLCRGPHMPNTSHLKAFKLKDISGAYWLNDKKNKMLKRVYGYAFSSKEELNDYIDFLKEVEKRDHRRLGRELSLFNFQPEAVGATFWLPKGVILRRLVEDFSKDLNRRNGYEEIKTPTILSNELWKRSGHWDNYRENMFSTEFEDESLLIKPMNCPGSVLVYKSRNRSYREFPLRLFELGNVFRRELSGTIHGLMRQREFTQDDAHIFLSEDMIEDEIVEITKMIDETFKYFGFEYSVALSTRPEKSIGSSEIWDRATTALKSALNRVNISYTINEGDGSFYGPKIDYRVKDAIGREWQCSTIQLDFNLPERFDLTYTDSTEDRRPIMIHRAIYGSIERFIGILIEHHKGKLPIKIAPIQARVLTISDKSEKYANDIYIELIELGCRADLDSSSDRITQKIKRSSIEKIPILIIVGEKEAQEGSVSIRELGSNEVRSIRREELAKIIS